MNYAGPIMVTGGISGLVLCAIVWWVTQSSEWRERRFGAEPAGAKANWSPLDEIGKPAKLRNYHADGGDPAKKDPCSRHAVWRIHCADCRRIESTAAQNRDAVAAAYTLPQMQYTAWNTPTQKWSPVKVGLPPADTGALRALVDGVTVGPLPIASPQGSREENTTP